MLLDDQTRDFPIAKACFNRLILPATGHDGDQHLDSDSSDDRFDGHDDDQRLDSDSSDDSFDGHDCDQRLDSDSSDDSFDGHDGDQHLDSDSSDDSFDSDDNDDAVSSIMLETGGHSLSGNLYSQKKEMKPEMEL